MNVRKPFLMAVALLAFGCQTNSSTSSTSTGSIPLPPAPLPNKKATVSWAASTGTVQGYKIEASINGSTFVELGTLENGSTAALVGGLFAGVKYYFRVRAFNQGGNSSYSPVMTITL